MAIGYGVLDGSFDSRIARIFRIMDGGSSNDVKKHLRCFVCDAEVLGRSYTLATCRTQNSRTRVIEKLGELVGEG